MLVAREQLRFVEALIAQFGERAFAMQPMETIQARYIAIVSMLRSIGHVFRKVDCDTPAKRAWADDQWSSHWNGETIFREFIEPNRNALLKEFRGGLTLRSPGMSSPAFVANPGHPEGCSTVVDFDAVECRDSQGRLVLPLFKSAVSFWDRMLKCAEVEWKLGQ
jgi:hypothetical protein